MLLLYSVMGAAWGWLCYKHVSEILPMQVRSTEILCTQTEIYYRYE